MIQIYIDLPDFKRWYSLPITPEAIVEDIENPVTRKQFLAQGTDYEISRYTIYDVEHTESFYLYQFQHAFEVLQKFDFVPRYIEAFFEFFHVTDVEMLETVQFYDSREEVVERIAENLGLMDIRLFNANVYYYLDDELILRDFFDGSYEARNDVIFEFI
ncbi:hypothetical protein ACVRZR_06460 [Streptococcus entericus]|uniref:hypothetical protein n=1 Tax=Streptococcus entericus TaxID=155680 RepID=UPI00037649A0|nr:hypothetical protein [Streptococcus entericus]